MVVETFEIVETIEGKFVIVAPSPENARIILQNTTINGNKVPLSQLRIGSCFAVDYYRNMGLRRKRYRVIGIGANVLFVEKLRKDEFENCIEDTDIADKVLQNLGTMYSEEQSELERVWAKFEVVRQELDSAIRLHKEMDKLIKELYRIRASGAFRPEVYVEVIKDIVVARGERTSDDRFEILHTTSGGSYEQNYAVHIVYDLRKGVFYIKAGNGEEKYLYLENNGKKKVSGNAEMWYKVVRALREYLQRNDKDLEVKIESMLDEIYFLAKENEKISRAITRKVLYVVSNVISKLEKSGYFRLHSGEIRKLLRKYAGKEIVNKFNSEFGSRDMVVDFVINSRGEVHVVYVNAQKFTILTPEVAIDVLTLLKYYLIATNSIVAVNEDKMNGLMRETQKYLNYKMTKLRW